MARTIALLFKVYEMPVNQSVVTERQSNPGNRKQVGDRAWIDLEARR